MATTVSLKPNAVEISGSTSGTTTLQATAVAGTTTLTLPAATDTLVGKATTDTLTNKTLTSPTITGGALNGTVGATTPATGAFTTLSATGVTTVQAGTAAAPAITTTGDTNTGIFFPAADTIAFSEGGAEAMRIDSSGNLGIGVTAPQNRLQVVTTTRPQLSVSYDGTTGLYLEDSTASVGKSWKIATSSAVASALEFYQSTATSGVPVWSASAAMTLDASGGLQTLNTIGVGNATPSTSGAGITFPATQSASSNANTLDDYEEGTWTPVFNSITGSPTGIARYVKVGRQVTLTFEQSGGTFTCTGSVGNITGIPFAGIGGSGTISACGAISDSAVTGVLALYNASTTGALYVTASFAAGSGVGFSITYFV
jgi:hypothetical protein